MTTTHLVAQFKEQDSFLRQCKPLSTLHKKVLQAPKRRGIAMLLLTLPMLSGYACVTQIGYAVQVDCIPIGFAQSEDIVNSAVNLIETDVSETTKAKYTLPTSVTCRPARVLPSEISNQTSLVRSIVEQTDTLDTLAVISVEGNQIGALKTVTQAQDLLDSIKAQYAGRESGHADFVQAVYVRRAIAPASMKQEPEALYTELRPLLDVESTRAVTYTEEIPFETITKENSELDQTYKAVVQSGQSGTAIVVAEVKSFDGEEQERTILERTVVSSAQNEVIEVGTKNIGIGSGAFSIPIQTYTFTSAFKWRWGRMHTGVDLAAPEGTAVFAADNGKVIVSQSSGSGYGNYIIIDHQNGFKTLYGHNSKLLVNVGDVVAKGDTIACSGNTGNSTGPHLHFEVHVNDEKVDPQGYLTF